MSNAKKENFYFIEPNIKYNPTKEDMTIKEKAKLIEEFKKISEIENPVQFSKLRDCYYKPHIENNKSQYTFSFKDGIMEIEEGEKDGE